jgi:dethiobiotin synthetase
MNYFVTAIGTDCGKTFFSAILCEAFQADYWKPIQAGLPRDADTVKNLLSNSVSKIQPETFILKTPASPHAAAKLDRVKIELENFKLPETKNDLVIEGAGGCMVPINEKDYVIALARKFDAQIFLVSNLYLGSINHTLLTAHYLTSQKLKIKGIVFNGPSNSESEKIILKHTELPCLLRIEQETLIDRKIVIKYAEKLKTKIVGRSA